MRAAVTYPYLLPSPELIQVDEWRDPEGKSLYESEQIRSWDPARIIHAHRKIRIDMRTILDSIKLGYASVLRLDVLQFSQKTSIRKPCKGLLPSLKLNVDSESEINLEVQIDGEDLGGDVQLITRLSLHSAEGNTSPIAAKHPGSILWRDTFPFMIEGENSLFPIEAVRFSTDTEKAGWYLEISPEINLPFLGGVRLYINSENKAVYESISAQKPSDKQKAIISALYYDVGRQMISNALSSDEFVSEAKRPEQGQLPFDTDSTGRALWSLMINLFKDMPIDEIRHLYKTNPAEFEKVLQHKMQIMEGI